MKNIRIALLAASMMAAAGLSGQAVQAAARPSPQPLRSAFGGIGVSLSPSRVRAKGWSMATDRRRAKKARNVARNRAAHRGGK